MNTFEKNNVNFGILITAGASFLLFLIFFPLGLGFGTYGDIYAIIGTIFGCYFAFRYRKQEQTYIRLGIIIGIGGAILYTILVGFFYFMLFPSLLTLLLVIGSIVIFYLLFGFTTGYIMAMIYIRKEEKPKDTSVQIKGLEHLGEE